MLYLSTILIAAIVQAITMSAMKVCQYYRKRKYRRRKQEISDMQRVRRQLLVVQNNIHRANEKTHRHLATILNRSKTLIKNTSIKPTPVNRTNADGRTTYIDPNGTIGNVAGNGERYEASATGTNKQKAQKPTRWNVEVKPFQPSNTNQSGRIPRGVPHVDVGNRSNVCNIAEAVAAGRQYVQQNEAQSYHVN